MKLGEILLKENIITPEQLARALSISQSTGQRLGYVLIRLGYCSDKDIAKALSKQLGLPYIDVEDKKIDPEVLNKIEQSLMEKYVFIPLDFRPRLASKPLLSIAIADPTNIIALDEISLRTGCDLKCYVASEKDIVKCIRHNFGETHTIVVPEYSLDNLFKQIVVMNASFALLEVGSPPKIQKKSHTTSFYAYSMGLSNQMNLEELPNWPPLSKTFMRQFCEELMKDEDFAKFITMGGITINYIWKDTARFRIDIHYNAINLPPDKESIDYNKVIMRIMLITKLSKY